MRTHPNHGGPSLEREELTAHLASLTDMTRRGKIHWTLYAYSPPFLYVDNPFIDPEDFEADITQTIVAEGASESRGSFFAYEIHEGVLLPSGLLEIHVEEHEPDTGYEVWLSHDPAYERLTTQAELVEKFGAHPIVRFMKALVEALDPSEFPPFSFQGRTFSTGEIPEKFRNLPLTKRSRELAGIGNLKAFHALVTGCELREGMRVADA